MRKNVLRVYTAKIKVCSGFYLKQQLSRGKPALVNGLYFTKIKKAIHSAMEYKPSQLSVI